jgi:hypothetical protein
MLILPNCLMVDQLYSMIEENNPEFKGTWKYFDGGLITRCHGSLFGGEIDAVQMEFPFELGYGGTSVVESLGKAAGKVIAEFYESWYTKK